MFATLSFVVLGVFSIWGVLYAFWLSFEAYPVDSGIWIPQEDRVCTPSGESTFVCLHTVGGAQITSLTVNSSVFHECTSLDVFAYLQGVDGGVCVAFNSNASAEGFLACIGLKDITEGSLVSTGSSIEL